MGGLDILDEFDSITISKGDIHDGNMRIRTGDGLECFWGILGFCADLKVTLLIDELGESLTDYGMIIHQENFSLLERFVWLFRCHHE